MKLDNSICVFFALLRSGLWKKSVWLLPYEPIDFDTVYQLADDQSVVGLIAAGIENVQDRKIVKAEAVQFLKTVVGLESRNVAMNGFIGELIDRMRAVGINTLLVKGQGIAQCYERPLWRSSGDIDFLLDGDNYEKAKRLLLRMADSRGVEGVYSKHLEMMIDSWTVELHGTFHCGLSSHIDRILDAIQKEMFIQNDIRIWRNGEIYIFLPEPNNDAIFVFTHILQHFYKGGIGLRQICDWCRLLWTFKDSIDRDLLSDRLLSMGLMSEWKAFAAFAVDSLGMPTEAMPLYDSAAKWKHKSERIRAFIMKVGNFGHNRDVSYYKKYPYLLRKTISMGQRIGDLCRHALIFPIDSLRFFPSIVFNGLRAAAKGE